MVQNPEIYCVLIAEVFPILNERGDGDSSVVRAPDSRLKGPEFKSL